jgi:hypothetical protein
MSSARTIGTGGGCNGYSFVTNCGLNGGPGGGWNGGWYYNPYFNMYTYIPGAGVMWSPFGYGFFSPVAIFGYYTPTTYWGGGGVGRQTTSLGGTTLTSSLPTSGTLGGVRGAGNKGASSGGTSPGSGLGGSRSGSLGGARGAGGARGR